jgi:hypothetical protein
MLSPTRIRMCRIENKIMKDTFETCRVRLDDGSSVLVDRLDLCRVRSYTWRAVTMDGRDLIIALESLIPTTQPPTILRRFIAGAQPGERVITFNGDTRDCRRCNLAIVSLRELAHLEYKLQRTAV